MKITWNWYELDINVNASNAEKTITALTDLAVVFAGAADDSDQNGYHATARSYRNAFDDINKAIDEITTCICKR